MQNYSKQYILVKLLCKL